MKEVSNELEGIESVKGTLAKEEVLKQIILETEHGEDYLRLVFDETIYGVSDRTIEKAVGYDKEYHGTYPDAGVLVYRICNTISKRGILLTFDNMKALLKTLEKVSGKEQIDFLHNIFLTYDNLCLKWLVRCISKDLHSGISLKTVNKVLKKLGKPIIAKFEVQLCGKCEDINEWDVFPCYASIKYDGFRCVAEKKDDKITLTSRQGKDVSTFLPEIVKMLSEIGGDFILDGEIMAESFSHITQRIGRKAENLEPVPGLHFRVFDILRLGHKDLKELSQENRTILLRSNFIEDDMLKFEDISLILDKEELKERYQKACDNKEEGIIIKMPEAKYEYGGRKNWFKVKPVFDATVEVTGFEYGKGKNKDTIGALIVKDKTGLVTSKVGSGLKDTDRTFLMELIDNNTLIGSLVDIKYSEISANKDGKKSLRFPRYEKHREDKSVADDLDIAL